MRVSRNVSTAHSRPPRPKVTTVTQFYGACVCLFFCLCVLVICTGNRAVARTDIKMHWGFKHPVLLMWPHGSWINAVNFIKQSFEACAYFLGEWSVDENALPCKWIFKLFAFLRDEGLIQYFCVCFCLHVQVVFMYIVVCFDFCTKVWQVLNSCVYVIYVCLFP